MSTGFPHDPFHQIVNVHWAGERIAFRFAIIGIGHSTSSPDFPFFCPVSTAFPPPAHAIPTYYVSAYLSSTHDFTPTGILDMHEWDSEEEEWEEVEIADYEFEGMPSNPYLEKSDFGAWEWHISDPQLAVPDTPNAVDWEPLSGLVIPDIPVPDWINPPFNITGLSFLRRTTFTVFGRGIELDGNPVCYGTPIGGAGQQQALATDPSLSITRIPDFQATINLTNVRIVKQVNGAPRRWRPIAIQIFRESSKGTTLFVSVFCQRALTP